MDSEKQSDSTSARNVRLDGKETTTYVEAVKHIADPPVFLDQAAERRMYRKIDVRMLPVLAVLYLVAFLDRCARSLHILAFLAQQTDTCFVVESRTLSLNRLAEKG